VNVGLRARIFGGRMTESGRLQPHGGGAKHAHDRLFMGKSPVASRQPKGFSS
jgi:hypothetical protein